MSFHVPEEFRITGGPFGSNASHGNNGHFRLTLRGEQVFAIASDGMGWEHVSVSFVKGSARRTPSWRQMCEIKAIFWGAEDAVMQLHPPESNYVSNHPGCLLLWRPTEVAVPLPDTLLVGVKEFVRK